MSSRQVKCRLIMLCLSAAILLVYLQVVRFDFVLLDDAAYVYDNDYVKGGFSISGTIWAFTTFHASNWHPITWLSHMLDVEIFGMHPGGHHLTSLVLHIINSLVLFMVLVRGTGRIWTSAVVSSLFALHPLHIESVAWIAERKDVLSTLFFMLSLRAYIFYSEQPSLRRYLNVALFFVLGLMAKPMLVTFPFVLLLIDYWPLRRIRIAGTYDDDRPTGKNRTVAHLLVEKAPLFILSAISCTVTYIAQKAAGSVASIDTLPFGVRMGNSLTSYAGYLTKTVWPDRLSVYYPYPEVLPCWQIVVSGTVLAAVSVMAVCWIAKRPWFAVGWFWFMGTMVPVIGLVQVGTQAMADRYTYIPSVGIFIMVAWWGREFFNRLGRKKTGLLIAGGFLVVLTVISRAQVGVWENSTTLFEHAVGVTERNYLAHHSLGMALEKTKNFAGAAEEYRSAILINPVFSEGYNSLGAIQAMRGDFKEAKKNFMTAISIDEKNAKAHSNLGKLALRQGKVDAAISCFSESLRWDPSAANTYGNMGMALLRQGKIGAAIENFRSALELDPDSVQAKFNLEKALTLYGEIARSVKILNSSLRNCSSGCGCNDFHELAKGKQKVYEAVDKFKKALSTQPGYASNHFKLENMPEVAQLISQSQRVLDVLKNSMVDCAKSRRD